MTLAPAFEALSFFGELGFFCIGDISMEAVYVHWDGFSSSGVRWGLLALVLWSEETRTLLHEEGTSLPSSVRPFSALPMSQGHNVFGNLVVEVVGAHCVLPFIPGDWLGSLSKAFLEEWGQQPLPEPHAGGGILQVASCLRG